MTIEWDKIEDWSIDGVDHKDHPDYCDAFVTDVTYMGREATDEEMNAMMDGWDDNMPTPIHQLAYESLI